MSDGFRHILGIRFYAGSLEGLLKRTAAGGLIVVPAAPALAVGAGPKPAQEATTATDWRDVQARLLRLREAGEAYTSQRELAGRPRPHGADRLANVDRRRQVR